MKFFLISLSLILVTLRSNVKAEIQNYEATENTGKNKLERIDVLDSYMVNLTTSLKNMESKLDENSKKLKSLENIVNTLKAADTKKAEASLGERKTSNSKDLSEVEKLKADISILKNQDIEKLKANFEELNDTVKILKASIQSQNK